MRRVDADWLCGDEAAAVLADLASEPGEPLASVASLRKRFPADRAGWLVQLAGLRRRARKKFERADAMFFSATGLEQATDQWVAAHKAKRFSGLVADLCCGVGGDLIALAGRGASRGVDRDSAVGRFAEANAAVYGAEAVVVCGEATAASVDGVDAWHADPDRRPAGRRTTRVDSHSPGVAVLDAMHAACPHAGVKLAPAAAPPPHWRAEREWEWIGRGGECRQLVVWSGRLAEAPGRRRATVVRAGGAAASFVGEAGVRSPVAGSAARFLYEPDAAVLAAGLDGALADRHRLQRVTRGAAYLTGDHAVDEPLLSRFEVVDELPLRAKTVAAYLRERRVGVVEIKHRGVSLDPEAFRRQLKLRGDGAATLVATAFGQKPRVFVVRRRGDAERPGGAP